MASKILGRSFDAPIKPYNFEGKDYNTLRVYVDYSPGYYGQGGYFFARLTPELIQDEAGGFRSRSFVISGSKDPLGSWTTVKLKDAPRNSGKTIYETSCALELAKTAIGYLFDQRDWQTLTWLVQSVGTVGYTYSIEQKCKELMKGSESETIDNNSSTNQNVTIMANEMKAADLIGKRINVGDGKSYYVAKSVDGEKVVLDLHRGDAAPMELPMMFSVLKGMIDKGTLSIAGDAPTAESATDEVEVAEVVDIHPTVKPKPSTGSGTVSEPKPKSEKPKAEKKPKPAPKPKAEEPKAEAKADGKLTYSTYKSKKGKTCAKISGFGETDPAYVNATELHGSASWDKKNGKKVLYLSFGHRYAEAAKAVCEALNAGKTFEDCKAIIDGTTAERAQRREEGKAKREERKTQAAESKPEKTYTLDEVAAKLKKLLPDGQASIEDIRKLLEAA